MSLRFLRVLSVLCGEKIPEMQWPLAGQFRSEGATPSALLLSCESIKIQLSAIP
jgi:hypothetical protein